MDIKIQNENIASKNNRLSHNTPLIFLTAFEKNLIENVFGCSICRRLLCKRRIIEFCT